MVQPSLIEIKNTTNEQYLCSDCNKTLLQVQNNSVKNFQDCEHFHISKVLKYFYLPSIFRKPQFILKDGNYYYLFFSKIKDQNN